MPSAHTSTALAVRTIADRVFQVPELLDTIFSFLTDKGDVYSCALVCKTWSSTALDVLWREMTSALDLFGGLPESFSHHGDPNGEARMDGDPEPENWPVFERYARRVRRFTYEEDLGGVNKEDESSNVLIADSAWDRIARTRTTAHILPNLVHLTWIRGIKDPVSWSSGQLDWCTMLFTPVLKSLTVAIPVGEHDAWETMMKTLAIRSPLLESLEIRFKMEIRWDDNRLEDILLNAVKSLGKLRKLIVPAFWLTTRVIEGLQDMPQLRVVQYELFYPDRRGDPQDVATFKPELKEGAFPALVDLSLTASVSDTISFFDSPHHPARITDLFLHSPLAIPTITELSTLLGGFRTWLPRLTRLYLEYRVDSVVETEDDTFVPPSLDDVRAIHDMPQLEVFELYYQYPLSYTLDELESFVTNLPNIRSLKLNCEPFEGTPFYTSLSALRIFARNCPRLESLGLLLDVNMDDVADESEQDCQVEFSNFLHLELGTSTINTDAAGSVAMWLSKICTGGCDVVSGYSWVPVAITPTWTAEQAKIWSRVNEILVVAAKVREEERARRRALEKEVDDLRTRTQILMESAALRIGGVPA